MKRLFLTVVFLCLGLASFAQEGVGIFGGLTSSSTKLKDFDFDNVTQFRAGIAYKYPIALGFAVQPEFSYSVKGTALTSSVADLDIAKFNLHMGYMEAALQLQWGPDLLIFRPYALVEPFVGYAVNNKLETTVAGIQSPNVRTNVWNCLQRLEYGYCWGGGLDLFGRFQVSAKHYENLGSLYKESGDSSPETLGDFIMEAFKDDRNFGGWIISLTFFF